MRRLLTVLLLVGFTVLLIAAALPHSHAGHAGSVPHACVLCRAQTAQPHLEPSVSPTPLFQWTSGVILPAARLCAVFDGVTLPESRAPPLVV